MCIFTIATRFLQIRYFKEMIKLLFEGKSSETGISSFQAFCLALSGRVGIGNIAGSRQLSLWRTWSCILDVGNGSLGAASAFVESTLSQVYKSKVGNEYRGGTPYFIEKA